MDIRDEILRSVVIHYISDATPIGSAQLQRDYDLEISSATIRNHFKKLVLDGMLEQLHSSSGRIPTHDALIAFWTDELEDEENRPLVIQSRKLLEYQARRYHIYATLHKDRPNRLLEVTGLGQHLVLSFETGAVLVAANAAVERFLSEFKGLDMNDLIKIARQMGITEVTRKLMAYIRAESFERFNQGALIELAGQTPEWAAEYFDEYYDGDAVYWLDHGITIDGTVPAGCIVGKQYCRLDGEEFTLTYMGEASKDFRTFLTSIEGGRVL